MGGARALLAALLLSAAAALAAEVANKDQLKAALAGTAWQWDGSNESIMLLSNGLVSQPEWQSRGLVTRWEAVDRRTVLLSIEKGRPTDRYAVLLFAEDLQAFQGYDFHAARALRPSRRIRGQGKNELLH